MREALILAGLTIGAVLALFSDGEGEPVEAAAATPPTVATISKTPPAPGQAMAATGLATELRRAGDGHFYAGVAIGDWPVTMLVDTGASVIALTGDDARAAGLHWNPGQLAVVAQGASGPIHGVALTLDRVTLGGHEVRDVRAIIIPEGLPISLLGQSFLATIEPVRIEKDRMLLGEP
jgi:aspartyl protease family protein